MMNRIFKFDNFTSKYTLILVLSMSVYAVFMIGVDPYFVRSDSEILGKQIPYYPWFHYNVIRRHKKLDFAFMGSSQVNYFPIGDKYAPPARVFTMGIESSNIFEHIAYGKLLVDRRPNEIWFFITFYSLNPTRGNQSYFNEIVMNQHALALDILYQYFNKDAFHDAVHFVLNKESLQKKWVDQFRVDGTRTQKHYLSDVRYSFESTLADYLVWIDLDPRYYNSEVFRHPESLEAGLRAIQEFVHYAELHGVKVRIATAPVHRTDHALMYMKGLGETYEAFRQGLAEIRPFVDLDLNVEFTSRDENFWDTHHARRGQEVVKSLDDPRYLVTLQNVQSTSVFLRPTPLEIERVQTILKQYDKWDARKKLLAEDLRRNPVKEQ